MRDAASGFFPSLISLRAHRRSRFSTRNRDLVSRMDGWMGWMDGWTMETGLSVYFTAHALLLYLDPLALKVVQYDGFQ